MEKLEKEMSAGFDTNNVTKSIVAGSIYYHVGNFEAALRVLRQTESLEGYALQLTLIIIYFIVFIDDKNYINTPELLQD